MCTPPPFFTFHARDLVEFRHALQTGFYACYPLSAERGQGKNSGDSSDPILQENRIPITQKTSITNLLMVRSISIHNRQFIQKLPESPEFSFFYRARAKTRATRANLEELTHQDVANPIQGICQKYGLIWPKTLKKKIGSVLHLESNTKFHCYLFQLF